MGDSTQLPLHEQQQGEGEEKWGLGTGESCVAGSSRESVAPQSERRREEEAIADDRPAAAAAANSHAHWDAST